MRKTLAIILAMLLMLAAIPAAAVHASDDLPFVPATEEPEDPTEAPEDDSHIEYIAELGTTEADADQNMKTIRNAFALAEPGKTLTVKIAQPGTYYVGDGRRAWRMRSDTTFDLNGATLIRYGSQGNILQNCDYTGENGTVGGYHLTDNITIKNGTIDGAGETAATLNLCNIGHATGVHLENMNFRNGTSHLVEFSGCQDCTVTNCTFTKFAPGRDDNVEALQFDISDNDVSATSWNGVYYSDSTPCRNITVEGCTFNDFPTGLGNHKGIQNNHVTGIVVKNCKFRNSANYHQPAAWFYNFDNSEFSGNTITGNYSCGLNVSACRNTVIKDNVITLKDATSGLYVTLANSYVRGDKKDVHVEEYCEGLEITGNKINVGGAAIGTRVYSNSGISSFSDNAVTATGDIGVTFSSNSRVTNVKNNTIKATKGIGILAATSAQVGEISGNTIRAKDACIQVTSSANVKNIRNNPSVISSAGNGIFVSNATARNITGNTIKNCAADGISVTSSGVVSAVTGNTVTGCGEYGIRINNSNIYITFSGNKCTNNKTGATKVNASIMLANPVISSVANAYGGVTVKWGKVSGAAKYRVFFKDSGTGWKKLADTTALTYTDATAPSGKTRAYTVRCISADAKKFTSNYDTVGKSILYVAAPRIATIRNISGGTQLNWAAVAGAAKYRVFVKSGTAWKAIAATTATSYNYTGLKSGAAYIYTVRAMNAAGQYASAYNTTGWKYTYIAPPALPTLKNTKNGVQITYKKPAGGTYFRIFRKTAGGRWGKIADTSNTTVVDKTAKKGVTYYYTIRCINKGGTKFFSAYNTAGRAITCKR